MSDNVLEMEWFVVRQPWVSPGQCTYVIAGNRDPRLGKFVADCEDKYEEEMTPEDAVNLSFEIANHICELHNASLANKE